MSNDRIRALNVPSKVIVELDATGFPKAAGGVEVEAVLEIWRIDDEWWRQPLSRRCVDAILDGGKHVVLFEDLTTGEWWIQKP